jgi:two-component system sensor kinase FixL
MVQGAISRESGRTRLTQLADLMMDQLPAPIAMFDTNLRCVRVNARWLEQPPFSAENPVGHTSEEVFTKARRHMRTYLKRAISGETFSSEPQRILTDDGREIWLRSHLSPWHDTKMNIKGAMLVCENVTAGMEQKINSKILHEELSLYVENAEGFALFLLDDDGRITLWNQAAERLTGWSELEVLGQTTKFLLLSKDRNDGLLDRQLDAARREGFFRDRGWRVRKDGTRLRAEVTISRIAGDDLLPSGFGQILRDVTSQELQTRSLEANAVLLRSILETIPDALVVIDIDGRILMFSKAAEAMFGYAGSEVLGLDVSILMPERDREGHDTQLSHYRLTGEKRLIGKRRRLIGRRKDGTEFPHTLQLAEAFGGGRRMIAGFVHDLTAEEASAAQLEQVQRELAHIARLHEMGTLATTIAHELNQPLMAVANIVQTAADILSKGDPPNRKVLAEALTEAGRESIRAGEILRRLRLFLSRGDLEKTLEDPCKLAEDAIYFEAAAARYRNVACKVDCQPEIQKILVDRVQIQQVILNLVKNAIQSVGANGKVTVAITAERDHLRFTVSDTGTGVPLDRVGRLFIPFSTTKTDGMGLGLPICRSIIEAHGGSIWYDPPNGGGAAFVFTLPKAVEEIEDA